MNSSKKKILVLANSSKGVYGFRNEVMVEIGKQFEVVVSVPDDISIKELKEEGFEVIHTSINRHGMNPIQDIGLYFDYRKLLKMIKPDLVLTYTVKPNVYGGFVCQKLKIPYIATITGLGGSLQNNGPIKNLVMKMYKISLKGASYIFFQNEDNKCFFEKNKIVSGRSVIVPGSGVNLSINSYEEYPNFEQIRFLFIGRIMKDKGIDEFFSAAKRFHSDTVKFDILGHCDDDYEEKINNLSAEGIIQYYEFTTDVHKYLKGCSAVVLPSYHEGMSNVLQEAAAVGRPVIASNIPGCREIFEDGVTGLACEAKDTDSLFRAIEKFLNMKTEDRAAMGKAGRIKMEREFDRNKVVQSYMEKIDEMMDSI